MHNALRPQTHPKNFPPKTPYRRKDLSRALFIEYSLIFWFIVWGCIASYVSVRFRRENCMPATSGGGAVRETGSDLFDHKQQKQRA
jgi:hypothetical protein